MQLEAIPDVGDRRGALGVFPDVVQSPGQAQTGDGVANGIGVEPDRQRVGGCHGLYCPFFVSNDLQPVLRRLQFVTWRLRGLTGL